jgi:hypothetical protein
MGTGTQYGGFMKAPSCPFNQMLGKMKILSMDVRTALSMEELGERLKVFFGKEGLGLERKEGGRGRITFSGGGGYVSTDFYPDGEKTRLQIVTSEWAVQVKTFVSELP